MNKEILQQLIGTHNILFNMSVTGDAVVPMAQALTTLGGAIGAMAEALGAELPTTQGDLPSEDAAHE